MPETQPETHDATELLEVAPDAILLVDDSGRITFANHQVEVVLGWASDDLVGQQIEVLVPTALRHQHVADRDEFLASPRVREMGAGLELSALHADGHAVPVEVSLSPIPGPPTAVMAAIRDVGDRRAISEALAAALAHERAAADELRRATELRDEFLAVAAHELRTPLSSASGFATTVLTHWDTQEDSWRRDMVTRIERNTTRLLELTDRLLDVSHLRAGKIETRLAPVDMAALVEDTVGQLEQLDDRDVRLTADEDTTLLTDRIAVGHVVTNLLTNAEKYSEAPTAIEVEVRRIDGGVEVTVTDHGIGIPAEDLPHVFDHGYRVSTTTSVHGMGVGLRVVRQYTEALGGRLRAESVEGEGSTFGAWFPGDQAL